jgi:pimeloyl-ACP methyl ester carboxylesterase
MVEWDLRATYHTDDGVVRWASFGDGEPVVLLHGTPFSSFIWRDIAPVLASTRKVYVWDMLGFGQSAKHDRQDVSLAHQGRIFADLLKSWNLDEPSVVAHDVGGAVALRATLIEGVSFRHLTLVDAVSIGGWGAGGFFQTISEHPEVFMQLPDWATEGLIESKIRTASHPGLRPYALERYLSHWRGVEGRGAFYRQYAQAKEAHTEVFQERLAAMSIPVRIIWGQEDQWLPIEYARRLHGLLPRAEFAVIGGAGHAVQEDSPGQLLAYLMA